MLADEVAEGPARLTMWRSVWKRGGGATQAPALETWQVNCVDGRNPHANAMAMGSPRAPRALASSVCGSGGARPAARGDEAMRLQCSDGLPEC